MVTIIEALGKNYEKIKLKDNESLFGGKSYDDETLGNFMNECDIPDDYDYGQLCIDLEENGLIAIRPIAHIDQSEREKHRLKKINFLEEW